MASATIETLIKLVENLPEDQQTRVVEHVREYLDDLEDELRWEREFEQTRPQLRAAARRARQEIAEGRATPLDLDKL